MTGLEASFCCLSFSLDDSYIDGVYPDDPDVSRWMGDNLCGLTLPRPNLLFRLLRPPDDDDDEGGISDVGRALGVFFSGDAGDPPYDGNSLPVDASTGDAGGFHSSFSFNPSPPPHRSTKSCTELCLPFLFMRVLPAAPLFAPGPAVSFLGERDERDESPPRSSGPSSDSALDAESKLSERNFS